MQKNCIILLIVVMFVYLIRFRILFYYKIGNFHYLSNELIDFISNIDLSIHLFYSQKNAYFSVLFLYTLYFINFERNKCINNYLIII